MLSAVADYKFVEPQNILIDGGLMPLRGLDQRDIQGDAKKVLRGEDAAFLREAACRVAYLTEKSSGSGGTNQNFTSNAGPKCGGVCNQAILAEPLEWANHVFTQALKYHSFEFIPSSSVFIWNSSDYPSYQKSLPEMLSVDIDPSVVPDHSSSFYTGAPIVAQPIEELVDCISAFVYPTRRGTSTDAWNTGVNGEWRFEWNAGGYWDDYSGPYGPDAPTGASPFPNGHTRRENLEAIYSSAAYYGPSSSYNGWATRRWNPNSSTDMYAYLSMPQPSGIQWTDRNNVVHAADGDLTQLLIEHSHQYAQAIADFEVYQHWWIYRNSSIWRQDEFTKRVCVPVDLTSGDLSYGQWRIDKTSLYNAAQTSFSRAGASKADIAFLQSKGMQLTDAYSGSGATSYCTLKTIHGIFTVNEDLSIPSQW